MKSKRTISLVLGQIIISLVFALLVLENAQAAAPTQLPRPATPSATSVNNSATSIRVTYSPVANATSHSVVVFLASNVNTEVTRVNNFQSGDPITGLSPNTGYRVRVIAVGNGTTFTDSPSSLLSPLPAATTRIQLSAPTSLSGFAEPETADSIRLSFASVSNATSYSVQIFSVSVVAGTTTYTKVGSDWSTSVPNLLVTGLNANVQYVFNVTAQADPNIYASATSNYSSVITTNPAAETPGISNPQSTRVNPGGSVTFSIVASGNGVLSYQWKASSNGGVSYNNLQNETQNFLTLSNLQLSQNGNRYLVEVTNSLNGTTRSITSNPAILTVENASRVSSLSTLLISPGSLNRTFSPTILNYTLSISPSVTSLNFSNVITSDPNATFKINDLSVGIRDLQIDSNIQNVFIVVTAEDPTYISTYLIALKRVSMTKTSTTVRPQITPPQSPNTAKSTNQIIQASSISPTSGSVGSQVTVTGTGLANPIRVRMSGLPMTVINSTDSNLILEIPSGATSGTITITTSRGSISTSRFNVIP